MPAVCQSHIATLGKCDMRSLAIMGQEGDYDLKKDLRILLHVRYIRWSHMPL